MKRGRLITIGSFDGVHLGHRALLLRTVQEAKKRAVKSLAMTFNIPPRMVLDASLSQKILSTESEKAALLRKTGIDEVFALNFNSQISQMKPFTFFRNILIERLRAKGIVVGSDFRFGAGRTAGALELVRWGEEFEIPVWVIAPIKQRREIVSSSSIRQMLESNQFKKALGNLGHPYLIHGRVVSGRKVGRKLGFPTANLSVPCQKILPVGVYAVRGRVFGGSGNSFEGVCNVGSRPTFKHSSQTTTEVHIFGENRNLNGKMLEIELIHRLRSEKKFPSANHLKRAIASDIYRAKVILSES